MKIKRSTGSDWHNQSGDYQMAAYLIQVKVSTGWSTSKKRVNLSYHNEIIVHYGYRAYIAIVDDGIWRLILCQHWFR